MRLFTFCQSKKFMAEEMTTRDIICPKCSRYLGVAVDGVYIQIGNAEFYNRVRFSCLCGKPISFSPMPVGDGEIGQETTKILNGLALEKKGKGGRYSRSEKGKNGNENN